MLTKKHLISLSLGLGLAACTTVDNYMLGKDNSPAPQPLKPLVSTDQMHRVWTTSVGAPQKKTGYLKLTPIISGKTAYVADVNGNVSAVDRITGKLLWKKKENYRIVSGLSLAHGVLLFAGNDSELIALKQSDGELLWNTRLSGDVLAKPVIAGNDVLAKTIDGNVYALSLQTGKQRWVAEHGAPGLVLKASSSPVLFQNNRILVGHSDGKLDAIELKTGQTLWERSIAFATGSSDVERLVDIDADPIVFGNTVILGSYQGYLGALSLTDGQFIWRKPASIYKNMTVSGNTLYFTDSQDVIWAVDKNNGQVKWKQEGLTARDLTEPVVAGNKIFVGDKTGLLHSLDASNGVLLTRTSVAGAVLVAPVVVGKSLYVLTANGQFSRYQVST